MAAARNIADYVSCLPLVISGGEITAGILQVQHMVGNPQALGRRDLRRSYIHTAVHLEGVAVYDLSTEPEGKRDRQLALA